MMICCANNYLIPELVEKGLGTCVVLIRNSILKADPGHEEKGYVKPNMSTNLGKPTLFVLNC